MLEIDKSPYLVLKIIYKHQQISRVQLKRKFPRKSESDLDWEISILYRKNYIYYPFAAEDDIGNQLTDSNILCIAQGGKVYIESLAQEDRRWKIPVIISTIALIFSGLALVKSFGLLGLLLKVLKL